MKPCQTEGVKTCSKCGETKPLTEFNKQGAPRTDFKTTCKKCDAAYKHIWNAANAERQRAKQTEWKRNNRDKVAAQDARRYAKDPKKAAARSKQYRSTHPEKVVASNRRWDEKNPAKRVAMVAHRRARKYQATPAWANKDAIEEFYEWARFLTKLTGFKWHVDHIVPLKHPLVQGLHCEQNLQIIPASENSRKKNYYWPDMP